MKLKTTNMSRLVALAVLCATLGLAAPAQADDPDSCAATPTEPVCSFRCPAWGVVKVTVHGPGDEGRIQGSVSCGTPPGSSGYIQFVTVVCEEDDGDGDLFGQAWEAVWAPLDDGECSAEMLNRGDGTLGQCSLEAGTRAVCAIERESILPEA